MCASCPASSALEPFVEKYLTLAELSPKQLGNLTDRSALRIPCERKRDFKPILSGIAHGAGSFDRLSFPELTGRTTDVSMPFAFSRGRRSRGPFGNSSEPFPEFAG